MRWRQYEQGLGEKKDQHSSDTVVLARVDEETRKVVVSQPIIAVDHHVTKLLWEAVDCPKGGRQEVIVIAEQKLHIYSYVRTGGEEDDDMKKRGVYVPSYNFKDGHCCILDASLNSQTSMLYFVTNCRSIGVINIQGAGEP